jgi:hypothetical protein
MNAAPHASETPVVQSWLAFILGSLLVALAAGCNRDPNAAKGGQLPDALPPEKAAIQVAKTFESNTDPGVKQLVKTAIDALKDQQFDAAYHALQQLKVSGKLNADEDMAVRNAIIGISIAGAEAAERGDAKAAEMMKNIR